jgi:hypothetical protein
MVTPTRRAKGSAISEFGPALFLLLILLFFPMLNLISLALCYCDCLYLNALLLRQAAVENVLTLNTGTQPPTLQVNPDPAVTAKVQNDLNQIINQWSAGFGKFAITSTIPVATTSIDLSEGTSKVQYIHVTLTCQCKPLVAMPLFVGVPGLSAPMTFQFNRSQIIENIPTVPS